MFQHSDKPLEEKEFPDEADLAEAAEGERSTVMLSRCPACGELIYDQAQQCPHCKEWVFPDRQGWRSSRKWYVRGGLYVTKTLLLNWIFWLALAAIAAVVTLMEILGYRESIP